ncbi:UNVERIFIED_CONTAM: hypothetical protein K2H54_029439 [Gekko kuhli]
MILCFVRKPPFYPQSSPQVSINLRGKDLGGMAGFRGRGETDPIDYVENICENMHLFRKEDFLTGDQLLTEYNPEVIGDAVNHLIPQKANLILFSPVHMGKCPMKEKWFGTQYAVSDIDEFWSKLWDTDFPLNPDLHLPEENKYIATDFSVKKSTDLSTEYPHKILDTPQGCLWYKKDNKFIVPKAFICFHLVSPVIQFTAKNMVLFDTFVSVLTHNLAELAYEADVAQLEYKVVAKEHGLVVRVKGFDHKLPLLFQLIFDHIADFSFTPATFEMITDQLKKTYFNFLIKADTLAKKLQFLPLLHPCPVQFRVTDLPVNHFVCKVKSLHKGDANSIVTVYYQTGARSLKDYALMELLVMHMEEPCFDYLRTKQTLGAQLVRAQMVGVAAADLARLLLAVDSQLRGAQPPRRSQSRPAPTFDSAAMSPPLLANRRAGKS